MENTKKLLTKMRSVTLPLEQLVIMPELITEYIHI